eukprot:s1150_g21.t1
MVKEDSLAVPQPSGIGHIGNLEELDNCSHEERVLQGLLSSVACVISLARGGAFMLSAMRSQSEDGCSVAHLGKFSSQGLGAFRCEDGSLDAEHEGTVLLRHGWTRDAVEVYRMAPVYLHEDALPVAWAVAKDGCLDGLRHQEERASVPTGFRGTARRLLWERFGLHSQAPSEELSHTLGFSKEKDFHLQSMPLVALTDPSNPFGSKQMLTWAAVFYFLALLTLLAFQLEFRGTSNDYELLSTKSPETDNET